MSSEKQYIQLFADNETLICEHSCPAMNAVRHTASEAFTRLGFPSRKTEEYKYIDVDNAFAPDYGVNVKRIPFALDANKAFRCSVPNMDSAVYFMAGDRFIPSTQTNGVSQEGVYIGSICDFDCTHPGKLNAFYGKQNLNPQIHEASGKKSLEIPDGIDPEVPTKVLSNPEMLALLSSLAKSMQK